MTVHSDARQRRECRMKSASRSCGRPSRLALSLPGSLAVMGPDLHLAPEGDEASTVCVRAGDDRGFGGTGATVRVGCGTEGGNRAEIGGRRTASDFGVGTAGAGGRSAEGGAIIPWGARVSELLGTAVGKPLTEIVTIEQAMRDHQGRLSAELDIPQKRLRSWSIMSWTGITAKRSINLSAYWVISHLVRQQRPRAGARRSLSGSNSSKTGQQFTPMTLIPWQPTIFPESGGNSGSKISKNSGFVTVRPTTVYLSPNNALRPCLIPIAAANIAPTTIRRSCRPIVCAHR